MPLLDVTNPRVIDFLLECYEKESRLRSRWVNLHEKQIRQAASFIGVEKNYSSIGINKLLVTAGMATITRDHIVSARHRVTKPIKDYMLVEVGDTKPLQPSMISVEEKVKALLHKSKKDYEKARSNKAPEDKYHFVESGNWKYGWKLGDSDLKLRGPQHGRVCHSMHNMNSRVGPQPDPDYYPSSACNRAFCYT